MNKRILASFIVAVIVLLTTQAIGSEAILNEDGTTTWQAGVDGVEIVWNPDGTVRKLYSRYSQPVEFPDRRGISTAQVIAEEKAKGAIVRFMDQAVISNRLVTEIETDLNKMTQERQTGLETTVKKVDQRDLVTNLTEVTGSFAAGELKGVIVLEKGYDDKLEEVWVVVGISEKTIAAANAVKKSVSDNSHMTNADDIKTQPSETRKSNQKDF